MNESAWVVTQICFRSVKSFSIEIWNQDPNIFEPIYSTNRYPAPPSVSSNHFVRLPVHQIWIVDRSMKPRDAWRIIHDMIRDI